MHDDVQCIHSRVDLCVDVCGGRKRKKERRKRGGKKGRKREEKEGERKEGRGKKKRGKEGRKRRCVCQEGERSGAQAPADGRARGVRAWAIRVWQVAIGVRD